MNCSLLVISHSYISVHGRPQMAAWSARAWDHATKPLSGPWERSSDHHASFTAFTSEGTASMRTLCCHYVQKKQKQEYSSQTVVGCSNLPRRYRIYRKNLWLCSFCSHSVCIREAFFHHANMSVPIYWCLYVCGDGSTSRRPRDEIPLHSSERLPQFGLVGSAVQTFLVLLAENICRFMFHILELPKSLL